MSTHITNTKGHKMWDALPTIEQLTSLKTHLQHTSNTSTGLWPSLFGQFKKFQYNFCPIIWDVINFLLLNTRIKPLAPGWAASSWQLTWRMGWDGVTHNTRMQRLTHPLVTFSTVSPSGALISVGGIGVPSSLLS